MDLIKLESNMPLRGYPEETLNKVILMDLLPYLTRLLSLTDETSAERLEIALPAIKTQCIGMGMNQIKKMFEMYVDSKLNLKPIPNYFDRILLGKIVSSYKSIKKSKPMLKEPEISEQDKENIMLEAVDRIKKEVEQNIVITSFCNHVYDYLFELGKLPKDKETKLKVFERAKLIAKSEAMSKATQGYDEHCKLKPALEQIDKGNSIVVTISKRLILQDYFKVK